ARDFLRFCMPDNMEIYRHKRVVFSVASSPFLLAASLDMHLEKETEFVDTAALLKNSLYVDNVATSLPTEEATFRFIEEAQSVMNRGCFNLRGWEHNALNSQIDRPDVPVLGLIWNLKKDTLSCNLGKFSQQPPSVWTKRIVLSVAQRVYDPIGMLSSVTLVPKLLLRRLWSLKIPWDEELSISLSREMDQWLREVPLLS